MSLAKELEISFQKQPVDASDFTTEIPALCEVIQGGSTGSASLASAHTVCVCVISGSVPLEHLQASKKDHVQALGYMIC